MSAFIVENDCINRIVAYMTCNVMPKPITALEQHESKVAFADRLRAMNIEAVNARYGETAGELLPDDPQMFKSIAPASAIQTLKSLRCFLYQCCEGTVDESALFGQLDRYSYQLAYHIVESLPEWDAADWG